MKTRLRVCVTGSTGLAGKGLEETRPPDAQMIGLHRRRYGIQSASARHLRLDVRDQRHVDDFFRRTPCDVVVHAAGIANVDYTQTHYLDSWESNVLGTFNMAAACQRRGMHLVYLSSNAVFDGASAPYRETDAVKPVNRYGAIKAECERIIQTANCSWTVVRPILMYGWNHPAGRLNFVTWVLRELRRGRPLHLVTDVYENPLYYRQLGLAVWALARRRLPGVFHVAGGETVNRYQFARRVADIFHLPSSGMKPVRSSFFPSLATRPRNTTLTVQRMQRELGIQPMDVASGLRAMREVRNGR